MRIAPLHDQWLDLKYLLATLLAQGRIHQSCAEQALVCGREAPDDALHPLVFLANRQLCDPSQPGKLLDIETLTAWLAHQAEQPYLRLDPLQFGEAAGITEAVQPALTDGNVQHAGA